MKGVTGLIGGLLVLTIIVAGVGMAIQKSGDLIGTNTGTGSMSKEEGPRFAWSFNDVGDEDSLEGPKTSITLHVDGVPRDVGTYSGSCSVISDSAWEYIDNEITGVICWWAGGGSEIGIFRENGTLVVKAGELDEGSAEIPGFRGNFRTLFEL